MWIPERDGRDGDIGEAVGQCEGEWRDILRALRAFWYCFGLIFGLFSMAIRRFPMYLLFHARVWRLDHSCFRRRKRLHSHYATS